MEEVFYAFLVYALGQISLRFLIEPSHEYLLVVSDIRHHLSKYVHSYGVVEKHYSEEILKLESVKGSKFIVDLSIERYTKLIRDEWKNSDDNYFIFRDLASRLLARAYLAPWMIDKNKLTVAHGHLLSFSNLVRSKEAGSDDFRGKIAIEILSALGVN